MNSKVPKNIAELIKEYSNQRTMREALKKKLAAEEWNTKVEAGKINLQKYYKRTLIDKVPEEIRQYHVAKGVSETELHGIWAENDQLKPFTNLYFEIPGLATIAFEPGRNSWTHRRCYWPRSNSYFQEDTDPIWSNDWSYGDSYHDVLVKASDEYTKYLDYVKKEKEAKKQDKINARLREEENKRAEKEYAKQEAQRVTLAQAKADQEKLEYEFLVRFLQKNPQALYLLRIFVSIQNKKWKFAERLDNLEQELEYSRRRAQEEIESAETSYRKARQELRNKEDENLSLQADLDDKTKKLKEAERNTTW